VTDAINGKLSREEAIRQCKKAGFTLVNSAHRRFEAIDEFAPDEAIQGTWGFSLSTVGNGILFYAWNMHPGMQMTMTIPVFPTRKKLKVGDVASTGCTHPVDFQRSTISVTFFVAYDQIANCWYVVRNLLLDTAQSQAADNHKIIYSCDLEEEARAIERRLASLVETRILI